MTQNNGEEQAVNGVISPMSLAFYRTRSALRIKLMYPNIPDGSRFPQLGGFMFTFAESAAEGSKYDWDNGISFFLSASEVGGFVNALETGAAKFEIYHDPGKGTPTEGQRAKVVSVNTADSSRFLNISMQERRIGIKLSPADERQLCLALGHSLRLCYGWF